MITVDKYMISVGSKTTFDQNTTFVINGKTVTPSNINVINVIPGEFKEVRYYLFIVPENASKLITFDGDNETFAIFSTSNNEIIGDAYCLKEDEDWIEFELS